MNSMSYCPALIDEWQLVPEVWDVVRRQVDRDPTPGQFLLTGSASPRPGTTADSGAGRIVRLRMRPMTLAERGFGPTTVSLRQLLSGTRPTIEGESPMGLSDYVDEILRSGFPGIRNLEPRARRAQLDGYLRGVVDRDVRHLLWLQELLGPDLLDAAVLTTGAAAYRRKDGIAVTPC